MRTCSEFASSQAAWRPLFADGSLHCTCVMFPCLAEGVTRLADATLVLLTEVDPVTRVVEVRLVSLCVLVCVSGGGVSVC